MFRVKKEAFAVIGKEGSTAEGEGFIQKLWQEAQRPFRGDRPPGEAGPGRGAGGHLGGPSTDFFPLPSGPGRTAFARACTWRGWSAPTRRRRAAGWTKWTIPPVMSTWRWKTGPGPLGETLGAPGGSRGCLWRGRCMNIQTRPRGRSTCISPSGGCRRSRGRPFPITIKKARRAGAGTAAYTKPPKGRIPLEVFLCG